MVNMQIAYNFALGACGNEIVPSFKNKYTVLVAGTYSGVCSPEDISFSSRIRSKSK